MTMNTDHIDFISSYCDRWCERCLFAPRCSLFATHAAIAMCGDVQEGFELAVGAPFPEPGHADPDPSAEWIEAFESPEMTDAERADLDRRDREHEARIDDTSIMLMAHAFSEIANRWLAARSESLRAVADDVVREALEIAEHDTFFISAKLHRALDGRDRRHRNDDAEDHPVQNDWNGSAKVALISITRSEAAWRVIAGVVEDKTPAMLSTELRRLARDVNTAFPDAWSFIRPGFDEPWR